MEEGGHLGHLSYLKSHHLQAVVLAVPQPLLSAVHEKNRVFFFFLRALMASSGGDTCPSGPLGSGTALRLFRPRE